jgi:hypothetical protein
VVGDTAVINNRTVAVEIERCGHRPTVRTGLSVDDVGAVIRGLEGGPDVTVIISWAGTIDENVIFAVNGASVFLGLSHNLDGVFQYVARGNADRPGAQQFMISGEPTNIQSRYVVDIETAATVVTEWLRFGEESSLGWWERQ